MIKHKNEKYNGSRYILVNDDLKEAVEMIMLYLGIDFECTVEVDEYGYHNDVRKFSLRKNGILEKLFNSTKR